MKRKLLEKKFTTGIEAQEYIQDAGYYYCGRKGIFNKYDRYTGTEVYKKDGLEYYTDYELQLYSDGYVIVYSNNKFGDGYTSITHIPNNVFFDYQLYKETKILIADTNNFLFDFWDKNPSGFIIEIMWRHQNHEFFVDEITLERTDHRYTHSGRKTLKKFEYIQEACDWAKEHIHQRTINLEI